MNTADFSDTERSNPPRKAATGPSSVEICEYAGSMLKSLERLALSGGLPTLAHLLELARCEAEIQKGAKRTTLKR